MAIEKMARTCANGHRYFKSSDCPTCPVCEQAKDPATGFLARLSNPARSALLHEGVDTIEKLAGFSEKEILSLHGIGKASIPVFQQALAEHGLGFRGA